MKHKAIIPKEESEQMALAELLDRLTYNDQPLRWCHVPNGGKRHIAAAVKFKRLGVKKGIPDILIFDPPPSCAGAKGAVIELKRAKGGKVSSEQEEWLDYFSGRGWRTAVCNGIDEAIEELKLWGYLRR